MLPHVMAIKVQYGGLFYTQAGEGDDPPGGGHEADYMMVYLCSSQSHHFHALCAAVMRLEAEQYGRMCQMVFS